MTITFDDPLKMAEVLTAERIRLCRITRTGTYSVSDLARKISRDVKAVRRDVEKLEHFEFRIGQEFWTASGPWICTDIGTRTIVAVSVYEDDGDSIVGREEIVFDCDDWPGCCPSVEAFGAEFGEQPKRRLGTAFHRFARDANT